MDYKDFLQQSEMDFQRSENALKEKDFPIALFWSQQGIEKCLKGYFLKTDVFTNPIELGHMQYSKVIETILTMVKDPKRRDQNHPQTKAGINWYEAFLKILKMIEKEKEKRIILWKQSLNISLTKHEKNIDLGLSTMFNTSLSNVMHETGNYGLELSKFIEKTNLESIDLKSLDERTRALVEVLISIKNNLLNVGKLEDLENTYHSMNKDFKKVIDTIGYGTVLMQ